MENFDQTLDSSLTFSTEKDLELTEDVATHWVSTGSWALFFAILLSIVGGILVIVSLLSMNRDPGVALVMLGLSFLLITPALLLWQFQSKLKKALYHESAEVLEHAFRAFRNLYVLMGILTILVTLFYLVALAYTYYQIQQNPPTDF